MAMKWVWKTLLTVLLLFILLIATSLILISVYQDKAVKVFLKELNRNLMTKVDIEKVNMSLFNDFPNISLSLYNVRVYNPEDFEFSLKTVKPKDTLCAFSRIDLICNLHKLMGSKLEINRVVAYEGKLSILVNKKKEVNYSIWKKNKKQSQSSKVHVSLKEVLLNSTRFEYFSETDRALLKFNLKKGLISGEFDGKRSTLSLKTNVDAFSFQGGEMLRPFVLKTVAVKCGIKGHVKNWEIIKGEIKSGNMLAQIEGSYDLKRKKYLLNYKLKKQLIKDALLLFKNRILPKHTEIDGVLTANGTIAGGAGSKLSISTNFSLVGGQLRHKNLFLQDIRLRGFYKNGTAHPSGKSMAHIQSYSAKYGKGTLEGSIAVSDFVSPWLRVSSKFNIHLGDVHRTLRFNKDSTDFSGFLKGDLTLKGGIKNIKTVRQFLNKFLITGSVEVKEGNYRSIDHPFIYKEIGGRILIGDKLELKDFQMSLNDNKVFVNGFCNNFWKNYNKENPDINLRATISSDEFVMDKLLFTLPENSESKKVAIRFPEFLKFSLDVNFEKFNFSRFSAENVRGKLSYRPYMLTLNSLFFKSMEGQISGGGLLVQKYDNQFILRSQMKLKHVNISDLFYSFNNFGQDIITNEHIKGYTTGNIELMTGLFPNWRVRKSKTQAKGSILIEKGELIDYKPMVDLGKDLKIEGFEHLKFSELTNTITIKNEIITFPEMKISSNAFDISVYGTHTFENKINYHMQVYLSDILKGKVKRLKEREEKFGLIEQDDVGRTKLFLRIFGDTKNFKIKYDTKEAWKGLKMRFKREKEVFRNIFRKEGEEDSLVFPSSKNKRSDFKVNWEERQEKEGGVKRKKNPTAKKKKSVDFKIVWDDQDTLKKK